MDIKILHADYSSSRQAEDIVSLLNAYALERGCCKITLEVLEGNYSAQTAYKKLGDAGYELDPNLGKALFWQKSLTTRSR